MAEQLSMSQTLQDYLRQLGTSEEISWDPDDFSFDVDLGAYPYSGLDWDNPWVRDITGGSRSALRTAQTTAQQMPGTIQGYYNNMLRTALGPEGFEGTIQDLAKRGVLSSTVASDAMANTAWESSKAIAQKGYESQIAGQQALMKMPSYWTDALEMGQVTLDPSEPYDIMVDLLSSLA